MDERATEPSRSDNREPPRADHDRQAEKLAALGRLARGASHDFANLLMVIAGHAELALDRAGNDESLRRSLEQIQRAAQQAVELCGELAAYAGRTPLRLKPANLSDEIRRIVETSADTLPTGLRIESQLAQDLPPIDAEPARLAALVGHLVANAADALEKRAGTIVVRTGRMTAEREWLDAALLGERLKPGEYVFLEVADTGAGMDPVTAARMFDPFFTTRRQGSGLGLSRALGIVRAHGGAIHVVTEPGQGTTIRVLFPPHTALSEAASEALRKLLEG